MLFPNLVTLLQSQYLLPPLNPSEQALASNLNLGSLVLSKQQPLRVVLLNLQLLCSDAQFLPIGSPWLDVFEEMHLLPSQCPCD